jgi:hypothetical protein
MNASLECTFDRKFCIFRSNDNASMSLRSALCGQTLSKIRIAHAHLASSAARRGPIVRSGGNELPPELQGEPSHLLHSTPSLFSVATAHRSLSPRLSFKSADLRLTEQGLLVDEKTGEVINEYGATRFDVAVRAIRGDFDPPPTIDNTERSTGVLMDSLVQWPAPYDFQFVVRPGDAPAAAVAEEMRATVAAQAGVDVPPSAVVVKERKGGKFLSITVTATVRYPELIQRVFAALDGDARVLMKY